MESANEYPIEGKKKDILMKLNNLLERLESIENDLAGVFFENNPDVETWTDEQNEAFDRIRNPLNEAGDSIATAITRLDE